MQSCLAAGKHIASLAVRLLVPATGGLRTPQQQNNLVLPGLSMQHKGRSNARDVRIHVESALSAVMLSCKAMPMPTTRWNRQHTALYTCCSAAHVRRRTPNGHRSSSSGRGLVRCCSVRVSLRSTACPSCPSLLYNKYNRLWSHQTTCTRPEMRAVVHNRCHTHTS
jgi:hypothetical protein